MIKRYTVINDYGVAQDKGWHLCQYSDYVALKNAAERLVEAIKLGDEVGEECDSLEESLSKQSEADYRFYKALAEVEALLDGGE